MKFSHNGGFYELLSGMNQLSFTDNFEAFTVEDLDIAAGTEVSISNRLQNNKTVKYYIILRHVGDSRVIDGDTAWTSSLVYLKNTGSNDVVLTVVFFGE